MLGRTKEKDVIDQMLDQIDFHGLTAEELSGENGLLKQLTRRFYSRVLDAEMDAHLGYRKNDNAGDNSGNSRNGYTAKKVITKDNDTIDVQVPRDRNSTFEPVIIPKHEKRTPLFNDQIISMYSFGMSVRDIQRHLRRVYGVEVSAETISNITESVMADVREWQGRPLEKSYPILFLDALRVNSRQDGKNVNKALYVAMAIDWEGRKEVLGLWPEVAKFCSECGEPLPVIEEKEMPKESTDEAGKKTWEVLKVAVREKFKIDEEDENSLIIDFDLGEGVIYPLFLEKLENSVLSEIWLEIISPIAELNSLDLEEVCNFVGGKVCGGVIAMENDSFALRTCMLMSKIDKDAVFRTMAVICSTACILLTMSKNKGIINVLRYDELPSFFRAELMKYYNIEIIKPNRSVFYD